MARREVMRTKKDNDDDILALCNPIEWWTPVPKKDAIRHIENNIHTYFASLHEIGEVEIHVVEENGKKYLRTDKDKTKRNNLEDLPDC